MILTKCERIVMDVIWSADHDMALQEIIDDVNKGRQKEWSKTAVKAFIKRLRRKHYIIKYRQNHTIKYKPICSREEALPYLIIV